MPAATFNCTLERRLENIAQAAMQLATGMSPQEVNILVRDEDEPLIQNDETPLPIIKLMAQDQGRFPVGVQGSPIRLLNLKITCRSTKEKSNAGAYNMLCANVEEWLDNTNLITQLTSATVGIYTKVAVRLTGTNYTPINNVREFDYTLSCKCIAAELTT